MNKERRKSYRYPLLSEVVTYISATDHDLGGRDKIMDVSLEGCFLEVEDPTKWAMGSQLILMFKLPSDLGLVYKECVVKWVCWRKSKRRNDHVKGLGLEFKKTDNKNKQIWDSYVNYLKNKQIITVSKRIIEEFFDKPK